MTLGSDIAYVVFIAKEHEQTVNADGASGAFRQPFVQSGVEFNRLRVSVPIVGSPEFIGGFRRSFHGIPQLKKGAQRG